MTVGFFIHSCVCVCVCVVVMMSQDNAPVSSSMWVRPVRFEVSYDNLDWSTRLDPIKNRGVSLKRRCLPNWAIIMVCVLFSLFTIKYLPFWVKNNKGWRHHCTELLLEALR